MRPIFARTTAHIWRTRNRTPERQTWLQGITTRASTAPARQPHSGWRLHPSSGGWVGSNPRVKAVCLTIIDDGLDLKKWVGSPLRAKRAAVLAKLRKMILSPSPAAKPIPKPLPVQLPGWAFGEVVGYRMANRKYALLHALNYRGWSTVAVRAPVVSILNWFSEAVPDQEGIDGLTYINHDGHQIGGHHLVCLAMPRSRTLAAAQFDRPGWSKPVTRSEATSAVYGLSGHEGGDIEKTLTRVLSPYWEDPMRPVHVPKDFPPDMPREEQHRLYEEWKHRLWGGRSPQLVRSMK